MAGAVGPDGVHTGDGLAVWEPLAGRKADGNVDGPGLPRFLPDFGLPGRVHDWKLWVRPDVYPLVCLCQSRGAAAGQNPGRRRSAGSHPAPVLLPGFGADAEANGEARKL